MLYASAVPVYPMILTYTCSQYLTCSYAEPRSVLYTIPALIASSRVVLPNTRHLALHSSSSSLCFSFSSRPPPRTPALSMHRTLPYKHAGCLIPYTTDPLLFVPYILLVQKRNLHRVFAPPARTRAVRRVAGAVPTSYCIVASCASVAFPAGNPSRTATLWQVSDRPRLRACQPSPPPAGAPAPPFSCIRGRALRHARGQPANLTFGRQRVRHLCYVEI